MRPTRRSGGFSLIELMVALVLGLVVTGAVISTFISVHSASKDTTGIAALADDGRMAISIMQQTLRGAGYMACNSTVRQNIAGGPPAAGTRLADDFTEALSGYEAGGTDPGDSVTLVENSVTGHLSADTNPGNWATTSELGGSNLSSALFTSLVSNASALPLEYSDVIAVHTTDPSTTPAYTTGASSSSSVSVYDASGLKPGEMGIVSNCANSVVDEISDVSGGSVAFAQPLGQAFGAGAKVAVADTIVFYVGTGRNGTGALYADSLDGHSTFTNPPTEIAPDIENMQVLYGIDTSGGMAATEYVPADHVASAVQNNPNCPNIAGTGGVEFNCVVSVKIAILAASPPGAVPLPKTARTFKLLGTIVTAPIDTRIRKVFQTTVSLRNTTN